MRREWAPEDLIACWTLVEADWTLVGNKAGATRLGFALLLKFFEQEGRFPRHAGEVPRQAVGDVAEQVKVDAGELAAYDWSSRSIKYHRAQIRDELGFRECTVADEARLTIWLAEAVCPTELSPERQREDLLARCRTEQLEPPGPSRVERLLRAARARAEQAFCAQTVARLPAAALDRLEDLVAADHDAETAGGRGVLAALKADPGPLGLETLPGEIDKLARVQALGLPPALFAGTSEQLVAAWRARAALQYPSDLRAMARPVRLTLLAALCWRRVAELTDGLVDLLIQLVRRIDARAEQRVEGELLADLRRVAGKQGILFRVAEASATHPDGIVREVVWPAAGGEPVLRELVREAKANQPAFRQRVRTVLRASYSGYYRRMVPKLLAALDFRCNNTAYRPVMDALALLRRYVGEPVRHYARGARVPIAGVVPAAWREAVVDEGDRIERIPYELCVLTALREAIRRREIWVAGAVRWRDPEADLPGDFERHRDVHYAALKQPLDPAAFVADLRTRLDRALAGFAAALEARTTGGVRLTRRRGAPWLSVPRLEKLPEPAGLAALKAEVTRRWGTIDLLDMLKEADYLAGLTGEFVSVASQERMPREVLRRRLLLALFALGTGGPLGDGHPADGRHRRAWRERGGAAARPPALRHARQPPSGDRPLGQGDLRGPGRDLVGRRDGLRQRLQALRGLGVEPHDRVACALRRAGGDELLARRAQGGLHLLPADDLLGQRGGRDAGGAAPARHRGRGRGQLHRQPRRQRGRLRLLPPARLPAAPPPEADRRDPALPPGRRAGLSGAGGHPDPPHPLGADRPAVRPAGQVHHRAPAGHGRGRAGPAPLHPRRPQAPHLPRPGGAGAGGAHHLRLRVPGVAGAAAGDPRGAPGRGALEFGQHGRLLRQGRGVDRCRPRAPGGLHAGPAPPAVGPGPRQHLAPATGAGRAGLGAAAVRGRPAGVDPALLVERQPLWALPPGDGPPPRPARPGARHGPPRRAAARWRRWWCHRGRGGRGALPGPGGCPQTSVSATAGGGPG